MLKTNIEWLYPELLEEVKFFDGWENLDMTHNQQKTGDGFFDTVNISGKEYSYTNILKADDYLQEKRNIKKSAKLAIYKSLSLQLNQVLPWGALTGIRPVKYAYSLGSKWKEIMKDELFISENKLDLIERIIKMQKGIYSLDRDNVDLYISVPFCPSRCLYCSFISNEISKEKRLNEYIDCLSKEIESVKPLIKNLRAVYIGGGTPVALPNELLEKVLKAVGKVDCEYTVEAGRPDAINEDNLRLMKKYGVSRICVNPQTFKDETLKAIGRRHTAKDIVDKFYLAREVGFDINMDLIAGLPGESVEDFKKSVDKAVELNPDDITIHTLSLKKGSVLKEIVERLPSGDIGEMLDYSANKLIESGYNPYYMYRQKYMAGNMENTGYAKKGKACVYNIDVMEETTDNIACGANGVSKRILFDKNDIIRYGSPKDIKTYVEKIDKIIEEKNKFYN